MSNINLKSLKPAIVVKPAEILNDELKARKISQKDFAEMMDISATQLNEILKSKRDINVNIAIRLENILGIKAEFWLKIQNEYNLQSIRNEEIYLSHKEGFEKKYLRTRNKIIERKAKS